MLFAKFFRLIVNSNLNTEDTEANDKNTSSLSSKKIAQVEIEDSNKASPLLKESTPVSRSSSPNMLTQVKTMMQVKSVLKSKLNKNKDLTVPSK